jgi:hypothetical protein
MHAETTLEATRELLAVLPLLNRLVAAEVRREAGEETTMPQFRVLAHLSAGPLTLSVLAKKRRVSLQSMSAADGAAGARGTGGGADGAAGAAAGVDSGGRRCE